ncbi:Rpn family recombination-promoting nuclease/putative transposase [Clostridium neonatale]|nr:Rpn family recombination-promoting nuclease/putative transposase [Clostridium neonatale]
MEIDRIEMPENQKTIDLLLECKGIRLDVYVKDENDTVYNIEMQRTDNKNLGKRMRYYQGNIDIDCIQKGQDYRELTKSYVIFICTFDYFNEGRHKYTFENVCLEDSNIKLKDDAQKIILNTKGCINDLDMEILEFLNYVEDSTDAVAANAKSELVKHIHERVNAVKKDKNMEVEFMTLLERDREKIEEGKTELLLKQLNRKFKELPKIYEEKIMNLSEEKVEEIGLNIFDLESIEDLKKFFR